ncbi:ABC transporter permease [Thalassotalea sp. LPB0316]|uniref:ABC transporter permease n=1 Tax=Thalassotalea sp. LPB0316 TaxID=2769490 RepID=UPI0018674405|nr:ABC transporter permease [Thalassotalea sp. LPB0316]QOL24407.1 ABC transporter permease [Thalassotalea sp. LPB0316]
MASVQRRNNFQIWCDVVFALFVREIKSQFNDKVGISWAVINPLIFIFFLSYFRSLISGNITHYMPTLVFMIYGMLMVRMFLSVFDSTASAINKNKALFAFRQVQPISTIIATAVFELLTIVFVVIVLMLILYLLNIGIHISDPITILLCIVNVWLLAVGLGLAFAVARAFVPEIEKLRALIQRPLFFMSGIFFSLKDIPKEYWYIFDWNPILHAVELSRDAAYPMFNAQGVSLSYMYLCTLVLVAFSLFAYQACWKRVLSR